MAASNRVRVFGKPITQSNVLKPKSAKPLGTISAIAAPRPKEQTNLVTPMTFGFEDIIDKENVEPMLIDEMEEDFLEEADDIDAGDREDPQCVTEYVNQIYEYLREKEVCLSPNHSLFLKIRSLSGFWMMCYASYFLIKGGKVSND